MQLKKGKLLVLIFAVSLYTVGCNQNDIEIEKEIEVVDEFLLAGDNNEDVKENSSDIRDKEKEEFYKIEEKVDDNSNVKKEDNSDKKEGIDSDKDAEVVEEDITDNKEEDSSDLVFEKSDIPENIKSKMIGKSMPSDATIDFSDLSYLRISHIDFNGNTQIGEMVVNKALAQEVLDIFKELYDKKYPIEKMNLIDEYNAVDEHSMSDNNTSAFCYRVIAGTSKVSNHGKGVAIDINPLLNPHVVNGQTSPASASKYKDRTLNEKGMISKGDDAYNAFIKRGWRWGGSWNNPDYQHFEKRI